MSETGLVREQNVDNVVHFAILSVVYIIREESPIFAPQRLRF